MPRGVRKNLTIPGLLSPTSHARQWKPEPLGALHIAAFPDSEILPPPRSFAEKTYDVVHFTTIPSGGPFAALEEPALMLADLRTFIATVTGGRI